MALTRINNNSLSSVTSAGIPGHGSLTNVEVWELPGNLTSDKDPITTWTRQDETGLGTAVTQSSGIFTFPSTGYWLIDISAYCRAVSGSLVTIDIATTTDNSTYTVQAIAQLELSNTGGQADATVSANYIFDVTNTSTHKFKTVLDVNDSNNIFSGFSDGRSHMTLIRLGDT